MIRTASSDYIIYVEPGSARLLLDSCEKPVAIGSLAWRFGVGVPGDAVNTSM